MAQTEQHKKKAAKSTSHPAGEQEVHDGLVNVFAGRTKLCQLMHKRLCYRQYEITSLFEVEADFEQVAYLLLHGDLPDQNQLDAFRGRVQQEMTLPRQVSAVINRLPKKTPAMSVLRTAVSLLGHYDEDAEDHSLEANLRKSERLLGQTAAAIQLWARRLKRTKTKKLRPDKKTLYGGNLLAMISGERGSERTGRVLDKVLMLYAEHGFNASTFTARTIASSQSDMHSAICGAIGSLKGTLHGGAIAEALKQFEEIGSIDNLPTWYADREKYNRKHRDNKKPYMGFGHRFYKKGDSRVPFLESASLGLRAELEPKWADLAIALQELLAPRDIHANVDLPAAYTLDQLGIPVSLFATIFACGRMAGWCAHFIEHRNRTKKPKLIRPLSRYNGPPIKAARPISERGAGRRTRSERPVEITALNHGGKERHRVDDVVVFISYSHDSEPHSARVRGLAASLARDGCECRLDVHKESDEDWPAWMTLQLLDADVVLCVATEPYDRRFRDKELSDVGLGVGWEAGLIRRLLYAKKLRKDGFCPVVFESSEKQHIPLELQGYDYFVLDSPSGYEALLRKVLKRPLHARPATGAPPDLPTHATEPLFRRPGGDELPCLPE